MNVIKNNKFIDDHSIFVLSLVDMSGAAKQLAKLEVKIEGLKREAPLAEKMSNASECCEE